MEASGDGPRSPSPGTEDRVPPSAAAPAPAPRDQGPPAQGPPAQGPPAQGPHGKGPPSGDDGPGRTPGDRDPANDGGPAKGEPPIRRAARGNLSTISSTLSSALVLALIANNQHNETVIIIATAILLAVNCAVYAISFVIPAIPGIRAQWRRRQARRAHQARRAARHAALLEAASPAPVPLPPEGPVPLPPEGPVPLPPEGKAISGQLRRLIVGGVLAAVVVTAVTFLLGFWVLGDGFAHGSLPGTGGLLAIAAVGASLAWWVRRGKRGGEPGARLRAWASSRRNSALLVCAAALGLSAGGSLGAIDLAPAAAAAACPPPAELRVLASSEILGALQAAIPVFEQDERAEFNQPCYAVDLTAYAAPTDRDADNGLAGSWNLTADGPRPDIWIPASSAEVAEVKDVQGTGAPELDPLGSIASSPLILAAPSALVGPSLRASEEHGVSLNGLYQALSAANIGLQVPSPVESETGLLGVTGLYQALTGTAEQQIEGAGSLQSDTDSGSTLCAAAQAALPGPQKTAYLVSEAAMTASNDGQLAAPACGTLTSAPPPLTAFYPAGGGALDFQFSTVTWGDSASDTTRADDAQAFYHWLISPAGQRALAAQGLEKPQNPRLPSADAMAQALATFTQGQPPAHVLIAIDDSQPMRPYLTQIASDVNEVLGPRAPNESGSDKNSFGIWEFPGNSGGTSRVLVPFGSATQAQRARVPGALADLSAQDHHSAQFNMLAQAAPFLVSHAGSQSVSTVIMFTDGDSYSPTDPSPFFNLNSVKSLYGLTMPGGARLRVFIIAYGPPGCAESPSGQAAQSLTALATATGGTCWNAATTDPGQVLGQLWTAG
jgi:Bacterial extracellular solute-binding protein